MGKLSCQPHVCSQDSAICQQTDPGVVCLHDGRQYQLGGVNMRQVGVGDLSPMSQL